MPPSGFSLSCVSPKFVLHVDTRLTIQFVKHVVACYRVMKMNFDEKDEAIRFRLSTSMKRKLQLIAMRRGLNMSQFIRNYIETIINEDENQDMLAARDAR